MARLFVLLTAAAPPPAAAASSRRLDAAASSTSSALPGEPGGPPEARGPASLAARLVPLLSDPLGQAGRGGALLGLKRSLAASLAGGPGADRRGKGAAGLSTLLPA
jgi:hypothetical protein